MRSCKRLMQRHPGRPALAALALLAGLAAPAQQATLPTRQLTAGVHLITAELAADEPSREIGLMFRRELPANHGMLFQFERAELTCMWMRNTLIPLSVAFIDADGTIVNIEDMEPQTEQTHCARRPVRFALEMSRGWFAERGLRPAQAIIGGLPAVPRTP